MHILTVDDSASIRKPLMRRIGQAGGADAGSSEARDAIERSSYIEAKLAIESRTFDLILADVVEGKLEKPFSPETIHSTGLFLK